jgi:hypothetical protein
VHYKSRKAEVAEIWVYEKDNKKLDYHKGETYQVLIGFDKQGNTLYCAVIDKNVVPEPAKRDARVP